jgi:hypothetical protein
MPLKLIIKWGDKIYRQLTLWLSIFLVLYLVPVMAQVQPPTTELYRWYNTGTGDHFYTTDPHGENALTSGYSYEGITGYIGTSPTPGTTALYRWYNGPRPFSANYGNPQGENAQGFAYEGITGYIWTTKIWLDNQGNYDEAIKAFTKQSD